ncbi:MAG: uroporphyrinogen-III synthase [Gemmataceae bacterium]|nr:uroporphyrinogen-III synthase [Gemmataceae bacterium]
MKGRTVALAEGRQLEDLAALLQAEGAEPLRYPLLSILDAPDPAPALAWIDDLAAGRFALVVLMTGEAVRRLASLAERHGRKDAYLDALRRTPALTRGPKPGQALKELGLPPGRAASAPTTDGVIATLRGEALAGKTVGYTLYAADNPALDGFLREAGAVPAPVLSYVYAPKSDGERVGELIGRLAGGGVDALVITSTPQVERLFEVARERGLEAMLRAGLERVKVASVGPIASEALRGHGVRVDVQPEQGWQMKNLVKQLARALAG